MVQLYVEQYVSGLVQTVYALQEEAFLLVDPNKDTVIRELAAQEMGGVFASSFPSAFPIGFTSRAFAEAKLLSPTGETDTTLFAPSHVPSPPIKRIGLVILRVLEFGVYVDGDAELVVGRGAAAHVYVDQTP